MARHWTQEEDKILKDNKHLNALEISKLLPPDRDRGSVYQRSYLLGVKINVHDNHAYTKEEVIVLKENCQNGMKVLLGLLPGRTPVSIRSKARSLRLKIARPKKSKKSLQRQRESNIYRGWSKVDLEVMKSMGHSLSLVELSILIPTKSINEISKMKIELGI